MNLTKIIALVEKYMVDECQVYTLAMGPVNETTGVVTEVETEIYSGSVMLWQGGPDSNMPGNVVSVSGYQAGIPVEETSVQKDMFLRITTSQDERLTGRVFTISAVNSMTYAAFRWLKLDEVSTDSP